MPQVSSFSWILVFSLILFLFLFSMFLLIFSIFPSYNKFSPTFSNTFEFILIV